MNYEWCKIELLDRRVRFGRCCVVEVLGQQWLRVEVPFPEKRTKPTEPMYTAETLNGMHEVVLSLECKKAGVYPPATVMTRQAMIGALLKLNNVETEEFATVKDYSPNALFSRTVVTEEQVREALRPLKPRVCFTPKVQEQEGGELLQNGYESIKNKDESMPAPNPLQQVFDRIENASWSPNQTPGERILLECAAGFDGIGRPDAAKNARRWADGCTTDARALRHLLDFQWNERADLPVAMRDLFGIDRYGNACYNADDIDEYLRQTGKDDPFEESSVAVAAADNQALSETQPPPIENEHQFVDVDGDVLCMMFGPNILGQHKGAVVEFVGADHWCPNTTQLEVLYNRIGDILNVDKPIPYELSAEFAAEANAMRDALSSKTTPTFVDINEHSYVAAHIDLDECVRCHGGVKTHPLISQDGSANFGEYFGEYCLACKCSWWHQVPMMPTPEMQRPRKPIVDVRTDPQDETRLIVSINGADEVSTTPKAVGDVVGFKSNGTPKVKYRAEWLNAQTTEGLIELYGEAFRVDTTNMYLQRNGVIAALAQLHAEPTEGPFDMNDGHQTSRAAIDAAIARKKPVVHVHVDDPDLREAMREVLGDSAIVDGDMGDDARAEARTAKAHDDVLSENDHDAIDNAR